MAIVLVLLPGGEFWLGAQRKGSGNVDPDSYDDEQPVHSVRISPFFLSKYQVTQAQWLYLTGETPSYFRSDSVTAANLLLPVESVDWNTARRMLQRIGLRLPTEAEWEYAARSGSETSYSFGNNPQMLAKYAWFAGSSNGMPHEIGRLKPNSFGLYDIHGNVWEWCQDSWHDSYVGAPTEGGAWEELDATWRTNRGGGWRSAADRCRSASRDGDPSVSPDWDLGLRPARSIQEEPE
jgi:formylglycine-generating enzyme required for sulfatase activity